MVSSAGAVSLSSVCEKNSFSFDEQHRCNAVATVKAAPQQSAVRLPLDLVCVVDSSGSTAGSHMALTKQAMQFSISQLSGDDRLAVVTFSNHVMTVHPVCKLIIGVSGMTSVADVHRPMTSLTCPA